MSEFREQSALYDRLSQWIRDTEHLVGAFLAAGMPVPPPLDSVGASGGFSPLKVSDRLVVPNEKPEVYEPGWIWVPLSDSTPTTLALGILRSNPRLGKDLCDRVAQIRPETSAGTVYNLLARLRGSEVEQDDQKWWRRVNPNAPPVMTENYAWGLPKVFSKPELAAHRRLWIRFVLEDSGGLLASQIQQRIDGFGLTMPTAKDQIKADLDVMKLEGDIVRVGNSRKWALKKLKGGAR